MTEQNLKFSIIMPVYIARETIEQAISSVIDQTYSNWELIIINDACPDESCKSINKIIKDNNQIIQINNKTNQGVAKSRNVGIAYATGEVIAFLDADDYWHQEKLDLQVAKIEEGYDVVCSNYFRIELNGKATQVIHKKEFDYSDMLKSNRIGNLTGIYRCDRIGKVYQKNIGHEDYLMWLNIMEKAETGYCVQQPLAFYRMSENSLSSNKVKAMTWQWHIYRNELHLSLLNSIWFFLNYSYLAYNKHR